MKRCNGLVLLLLLLLLLNGCMKVGPTYELPEGDVETAWTMDDGELLSQEPAVSPLWWQTAFKDPELDHLIEVALDQNLSLRSAALKVLQAQQQYAIAVGSQFPQQQQFTGSASRQKASGITFNDYSLGFNVGWEIDFWGRFSALVDTASAELDASVAGYDGVLISLVSQVALNYLQICTNQERLEVARLNIEYQKESFRIAQAKFNAGSVSELDLNQAKSLLQNTMASVPAIEATLQQLKNTQAILLGKPPGEMNVLIQQEKAIPTVSVSIAVGMPQDLLRRRPDIRASERRMAAQSAQIGYAATELYPHLSIGGAIGTNASKSNELFQNSSETWSLLGSFEWNIFNYGRLRSNVRLQDALFQQLLVDYLNILLEAQGEVENAIVNYLKSHEQLVAYSAAAEASQKAVDISTLQYQEGEVSFNTLINTLSSNLQQQNLVVINRGAVAANLVQIYKALGGGWEIRGDTSPVDFLPEEMKSEMRARTKAWNGVLH